MDHVGDQISFYSIGHHIILILFHQEGGRLLVVIVMAALPDPPYIIGTVRTQIHGISLDLIEDHPVSRFKTFYPDGIRTGFHTRFLPRTVRTQYLNGRPRRERSLISGIEGDLIVVGRIRRLCTGRQAAHAAQRRQHQNCRQAGA